MGPLLPYTPPQKLVAYSSTHASRSRSLAQKSQQPVPVSLSTTCHSRKDTAAFRTPLDSTARLANAEIRHNSLLLTASDGPSHPTGLSQLPSRLRRPTSDIGGCYPNMEALPNRCPFAVSDFRPFIIAPAYAARPTHLALYILAKYI